VRSRSEQWRELVRQVDRHRRWISAGLVGVAVAIAVSSLTPREPAGVPVLTATRDLAAGVTLTAPDVRTVRFTAAQLPAGALTVAGSAIGRRLAADVRRGEPLTDVRLTSTSGALAKPGPGLVAVPIRLADAEAAGLLRTGMRIDVLAASTSSTTTALTAAVSPAIVVARAVTVIQAPGDVGVTGGASPEADPLDQDGALVVLSTTPDQALLLAQAQVSDRLSAISLG
jgi:pilus assembly protein CpaB